MRTGVVVLLVLSLSSPAYVLAQDGPEDEADTPEAELGPFVRAGGDPVGRLHLDLRATAEYVTFSPGVGSSMLVEGGVSAWNTDFATGAVSFGLLLTYQYGDRCSWQLNAPEGRLIDMWFEGIDLYSFPMSVYATCIHWVEIRYHGLDQARGVR